MKNTKDFSEKTYLSIIIVNWNTKNLLRECLDSIQQHKINYYFDVWVVDNASTDGSAEMIENEFPSVRIIRNTKNLGFAKANNQAIRASTGKFILLLNSDTIVFENTINEMVKFMDEDEEVGALGCKFLNPDGSLQPSCYSSASVFRSFTYATGFHSLIRYGFITRLFGRILKGAFRSWNHFADYNSILFPEKISGACMLLRRKSLDKVGLLNEKFFMFAEDGDLCYRLRQSGWKVAYTPHARIIHFGGQSTKKNWKQMNVEYYKSNALFFKIHKGYIYTFAFQTAVLFGAGIGLIFCFPGILIKKTATLKKCSNCLETIKWAIGPKDYKIWDKSKKKRC